MEPNMKMEHCEVIFTSDSSNHTNSSIYDLVTGNLIASRKGKSISPKCLSLLNEDYVVAADAESSMIKFWSLPKKLKDETAMIVPGKVSALDVSSCGNFCIAGIGKSIYLWGIGNGNLLKVLSCHFQPITCLKFTSDDGVFISGGADSLVLVWMLSDHLLEEDKSPRYCWRHHTQAVTDIHVGSLGIYSRIATSSLDMTCRVYDLETGKLVLTVSMEVPLTAVTMDSSELYLILGAENGSIYRINMYSCDKNEVHQSGLTTSYEFKGHKKKINCLSVSSFGNQLLSGSDDKMCKIWDIANFSCLRTIRHEGAVINGFIAFKPHTLTEDKCQPSTSLRKFQRSIVNHDTSTIIAQIKDKNPTLMNADRIDAEFNEVVLRGASESDIGDPDDTKQTVKELKAINNQLYAHCLNSIANAVLSEEQHL